MSPRPARTSRASKVSRSTSPHVQERVATVQPQQVPLLKGRRRQERRLPGVAGTPGGNASRMWASGSRILDVGADRSVARKTQTCSASSMVLSGGRSMVGASTGMSCAPSSGSSAPVSSSHSEREGDEEERNQADKGRLSTMKGPATGTLCSSTGSLADKLSESSLPGTSASSVDIHEEAFEADDAEPGLV
ncbi:hypothetical protein MRX96_042199 [Rhipicephalus microplus]